MIDDLFKAMEVIVERIKKQQELPPDTSRDGVFFIDTEEGSYVEIINNGMSVLMSLDMYQVLINNKEIQEKYGE